MSAREWMAERAFEVMLRAYPSDHRARYAREMRQLFRDRRRVDDERGALFWIAMLVDLARSAPALRIEALRRGEQSNIHIKEGTMRPMAIATVVVGVIQVVNALLEAWAGVSHVGVGYSLAGVTLGLAAAALLVGAGVGLLRRGWTAATPARIAAIACVAMVALTRVVQPWMSGFSSLLGFGFPIVLLLFLFMSRRGGPSMPMAA